MMGNKSKRNTKRARDKRRSMRRPKEKALRIALFPTDGSPICVCRPTHPQRALELVKAAQEHPDARTPGAEGADRVWSDLEKRLNEECGPYIFVGFLGKPGSKILAPAVYEPGADVAPPKRNQAFIVVGEMQPGDSFMHIDTVSAWPEADNVCEHGDHPAPPGKRFCSSTCEECEHTSFDESSATCANICGPQSDV